MLIARRPRPRDPFMSAPRPDAGSFARRQRGVFLIEALLGILIFSLGILALIGMQAAAISAQSDARYRIEAASLAEKMVDTIWLNVDRTSTATIQTSLATFAHMTGGTNCAFTGTASSNTLVTGWVTEVRAAGSGMPGATAAMQQIAVNTDAGGYNRVAVTVCWLPPRAAAASRHVISTYIN